MGEVHTRFLLANLKEIYHSKECKHKLDDDNTEICRKSDRMGGRGLDDLDEDRDRWQALGIMVMKLWDP
jgi:hypothetical protein